MGIRHGKSRNSEAYLEKTTVLKISAKYLSIYRTNGTIKKPPVCKIKITNRGKARILQILDEIIVQLHDLSQYHVLKKNVKKFYFLTTSDRKRVKFYDFRVINYVLMESVAKNRTITKIS